MMLKGKAVTGGIYVGPAATFGTSPAVTSTESIEAGAVEAEVARLQAAVAASRTELQELHADGLARLGEETAAIMEAHLMMLDDPELVGSVLERIRAERLAAPGLLHQTGEEMAAVLASLDDPYLRERAADVRDVVGRIMRHLTGAGGLDAVPQGSVLVAEDVPPSELLRLPAGHLGALALGAGGETSHTAILARSMGIPTVMGLGNAIKSIPDGVTVIVDGDKGEIVLAPDAALIAQYGERMKAQEAWKAEEAELLGLPAETTDGHKVHLAANIGAGSEAKGARAKGAEGVGLFRTEFLFLGRPTPPTEQEQQAAYREALTAMAPHQVVVRTLDIGGDKSLPYLEVPHEENPFLGWRGVRLYTGYQELFRTQLRALVKAAPAGRLQVMIPMVATKAEIEWVRSEIQAVLAELTDDERSAGDGGYTMPFELGIMVETPAAAVMADQLADLVDFFSIGTNDLTQYTMAADRMNPKVSDLQDPMHPAVLRLVRLVIDAAHAKGKWVGMCGGLAGKPEATPILVGLGLDEFSMAAPDVPRVKKAVRALALPTAQRLAAQALNCADATEVRALLKAQA
jgi:phosphotransferase system enzyme I (PtsI)